MIEELRYCSELAFYGTAIGLAVGMIGGLILGIVDIFKDRGNK